MADRIGYYGLAKRDLDRGGESVTIVSDLPVAWEEINRIAVERDRLELASDPNSPYRYFPTELSDRELADLGIARAAPAAEGRSAERPAAQAANSEKAAAGRRRLVAVILAVLVLAALVALVG